MKWNIILSLKIIEIKSFAATWMKQRLSYWVKSGKISYDIAYAWNKKNGTNELIYEIELQG